MWPLPVKTGIQSFQKLLDSRLGGNDMTGLIFKSLALPIMIRRYD
jgi:hypothetical protein